MASGSTGDRKRGGETFSLLPLAVGRCRSLIFPRIFIRFPRLPRARLSSSCTPYPPRYLLGSFSRSVSVSLDGSRGDRGPIPSRQFVRRWIVKTARVQRRNDAKSSRRSGGLIQFHCAPRFGSMVDFSWVTSRRGNRFLLDE